MTAGVISLDRDGMERRLVDVVTRVDAADSAIGKLPPNPDAGIASAFVSFITSAGAEAAGLAADLPRVLCGVAQEVIEDLANTDHEIAEQLREVEKELDAS